MDLNQHWNHCIVRLQRDCTMVHEDLAQRFARHLADTRDYTESERSLIFECLYTAIHEQQIEIGAHRERPLDEHVQD